MKSPYRFLFPVGVLMGFVGALVWAKYLFGPAAGASYPAQIHANLMMGGFLASFVTGFLMTAVPRFTGSFDASRFEIVFAMAIQLGVFISAGFGLGNAFHVFSLLNFAFLAIYGGRRFRSRTYGPPVFFVFVGLGLACGSLGAALLALGAMPLASRSLYYHGTILSFVLGVGGHLLPALLGWKNPSVVPISTLKEGVPEAERFWTPRKRVAALAFFFLLSFSLEAMGNEWIGRWVRAVVVAAVGLLEWRVLKRPPNRSRLALWLWISAGMVVLGSLAEAAFPAYYVHLAHLTFIGGFSLMTLMVATRVVLAHGGFGLELELRSKTLHFVGAMVLISALTRVTAPWIPNVYWSHLAYAALTWVIAMSVWAFVLVPKMVFLKKRSL